MFSKRMFAGYEGGPRQRRLAGPALFVGVALMFLMAGCGSSEPTPTAIPPAPTNTSIPTELPASPTEAAPPTTEVVTETVPETATEATTTGSPTPAVAQAESPLDTSPLTVTSAVTAEVGALPANSPSAAFVRDGKLYIQNGPNASDLVLVDDCSEGKCVIIHLDWSPSGGSLLYYLGSFDHSIPNQIRLSDSAGFTQTVTEEAANVQPAGWSPDGKEIVYRTDTGRHAEAGNGPSQLLQEVWTVAVSDDGVLGEPTLHGEVTFGEGCGGGGRSESANVYEREGGYAYGYLSGIMDWTPSGILLYSDNCSTRGVSRFDLNNDKALDPYPNQLRSLSLNGAGDGWVAIDGDNHVVTGAPDITDTTVISTSADPELVAYGPKSGTIYYTTLVISGYVDLTAQALDPAIQIYPYFDKTIDELVALNPATGEETHLYGNDGYAFARITEGEDGSVLFSRVEDNAEMQAAVENGELTAENWRAYLPSVDVLTVKPGGEATTLLANAEQYSRANSK